jgi:hypothetical protein
MLWQKGWLETRFRLLFSLGMLSLCSVSLHSIAPSTKTSVLLFLVTFISQAMVITVCAMQAGAGIDTQPTFQAAKGLHGSTQFTLSLPVSRLRLLAVRTAIGWLETAGAIPVFLCVLWFVSPLLKSRTTPFALFEYAATLIVCASMLYFLSVLLATFLDDMWRTWATMIAACALGWLSYNHSLPLSIDIVRATGRNSTLIAHTMPWSAMAFSLALAAIFFVAALKVVQTREY